MNDPETEDEAGEEEEAEGDEGDDAPRVVVARLGAVARWLPAPLAKSHADRPIWFLLGMDKDLVGLFERLPEDPMPRGRADAILAGLRAFATEHEEALQRVLGPSDRIELGFHVDASLARVVESFEDDGFEVVDAIRDGEVLEPV